MAPITSAYAGLLGLFYVLLSINVIRRRRGARIALGSGEDADLQRLIRVHGNFAEYAPIALVLILLVELGGAPAWLLHGLGLALLAGRTVHAYGVSQADENYRFRVIGMSLTFGVIVVSALGCLVIALAELV
jgi:uncharacterized membrane protein YecN with MAPEG domain